MVHFHELSDLDGFQQWFWKTEMAFIGVELNLPWWFGLSSWHYAIYGMIMLLVEPKWSRTSFFPYRTYALWLIFLQSPLSFSADYLHMSENSIYHVLDRMLATPAAVVEVTRLIAYVSNGVSYRIIAATILAQIAAMYCFTRSAMAQADMDRDAFVMWHYLWHVYPLVASVVMLVECNFCRQPPASSTYRIRLVDANGVKKQVE
mmetsp:Transcript_19041/g.31594  ORF Transcript_19041/g.31594 Transcript_19041/m.31594 type:complete len:204 (-) Transcript_19041:1266-1877(-)